MTHNSEFYFVVRDTRKRALYHCLTFYNSSQPMSLPGFVFVATICVLLATLARLLAGSSRPVTHRVNGCTCHTTMPNTNPIPKENVISDSWEPLYKHGGHMGGGPPQPYAVKFCYGSVLQAYPQFQPPFENCPNAFLKFSYVNFIKSVVAVFDLFTILYCKLWTQAVASKSTSKFSQFFYTTNRLPVPL